MPGRRRGGRFVAVDRRHAFVVDAAVPVVVAVVVAGGTLLHGAAGSRPLAAALGVCAAVSLIGRRRAPGWTLAISGVLVAIVFDLDRSIGTVAVIAPAVALYSLAVTRGRRQQLVAAAVAVAAVVIADAVHAGRPTLVQTIGHVLLVGIPLLAAEAMRAHRSYLSVLSERLELAQRTREQDAVRRAERERMRIARELHDVVAHTLTTINVQAGAAAERLTPGDGRDALERIEDTSREAIGELRAILGVLRDGDQSDAPRSPMPGVDDLPQLVDRSREAGLDIRFQSDGARPARLSEAVSLAAYRIVQESLTNAHRHSPGALVRVAMRFDEGRMSITVENDAGQLAGIGTVAGVGITGMRERATATGGRLDAGPTGDGFRVHAELPYELA
jgi:signal transduction histidine kinase